MPDPCQPRLARQPGDQRHEPHQAQILGDKSVVGAADAHQLLVAAIGADRRHQHPARRQPVDQRRRHLRRRGGHDDPVIGQLLGPALGAVAESKDDVAQPQRVERRLGLLQQFAMALDREHAAGEARQDRGLIARAGADLEHVVALADFELFGHQRHDIGLADRLPVIDRQGHVLVGLVGKGRRHEALARRLLDRAQYPRVADPGAAQLHQQPQLALHEPRVGGGLSHGAR